jgi:hypothetical protein
MTQRPHTYFADLANLPKALEYLTRQRRWVVWRWKRIVKKNGETNWTKPPYQCGNPGLLAKSDDSSTWDTYEMALAAVQAGHAHGIGFMLKDSEVAAADLDHVRDAGTGELLDWAKQLCIIAAQVGLYCEVTVSGTGLRFIGLAQSVNELHRKFTFDFGARSSIELYRNCARYITISGLQQGPCEELGQIDAFLDDLLRRFDGDKPDFDFNTAKPQQDYFQDLIENGAPEGKRSEKFQQVVWHLASAGLTIDQITDELAKHPNGIGSKYAKRLLKEVKRSYGKWQKRASGAAAQSSAAPPWLQYCQCDAKGRPLFNLANAMLALRNDPAVCNMLAYDEMFCGEVMIKEIGGKIDVDPPRPCTDTDVTAIQEWFQLSGLPLIGQETVYRGIDFRAHERRFHPVRDYLKSLQWDGYPRVETWLHRYLGAALNDYTKTIGRMFLVATVARIFRPGCQVDYMLILEGSQGEFKSTACEILGGDWFSDHLPDIATAGKDVSQHLRGKWIIEITEMSAMSRAETNQLKSFVTRKTERYRRSYGKKESVEPRQCVFIGTTNKSIYLRDETGNRRYWPVKTTTIDLAALKHDRDQLFAEAVALFEQDVPWWPSKKFEEAHIKPEQDERFEADPWEDPIAEYLSMLQPPLKVTVSQVAKFGLGFPSDSRIGGFDARRIRGVLESQGWKQQPRQATGRWWIK